MERAPDRVRVTYQARGASLAQTIEVQRVIMARGFEALAAARDPLMQRLIERGLARPDAQGLGLDAGDDLRIIHADGRPALGIWALGPIVRGVFWECVAVPDIRVQASRLAEGVAAQLQENASHWSFAI